MRAWLMAAAVLLAATANNPAMAQTYDGSMSVAARVGGSCTISSVEHTLQAYSAALDRYGTAPVTIDCAGAAYPASFSVDGGLNGDGADLFGMSAGGADVLYYSLKIDPFGFTTAEIPLSNFETVPFPSSQEMPYLFYLGMRILAGQAAVAGIYQDTVTLTVAW